MPVGKLPSLATTLIGVALGVLVALNSQVFDFGPPWEAGIAVLLTVAGVLGISVLSGPAFQTIIHLSQPVCAAIASALGGLQLLLVDASLDGTWRTILQVVLVTAGTLGFGPTLTRRGKAAFALTVAAEAQGVAP